MKVYKKILRIVLIICIIIGVFLIGSFIKSQHTDKVKQDIRESIEEREKQEQEEKKKQEQEEKKKQEEQALEEKRKQEEQKRLEEEKKKEEERQKLENQKLNVIKKMDGKWEPSYFCNSETNEIEYITNDEGIVGIIVDAGIDWLKSKDGFLSKLAGYAGEALLSGNEPRYILVDIDGIDLSSLGYRKYYFDEAVYRESPDGCAHSFEWLDEKGTGIGIAYYEEYKDISFCILENGQLVDNLYLYFCR